MLHQIGIFRSLKQQKMMRIFKLGVDNQQYFVGFWGCHLAKK